MPAEMAGQSDMGGYTQSMQTAWLSLGSALKKILVGTGQVTSLLISINRLRKWSFGHVGPPFQAVKLFSHSGGAPIGQEL